MNYLLKLDGFEGSLELLLQSIQKAEVDISQLNVSEIIFQYLESIANHSELDLDQTSQFLLLAATVLQIKTQMVLPRTIPKSEQTGKETDEVEDLVTRPDSEGRLNEYRRFRELAETLGEREAAWGKVYTRTAMNEALIEGFSASLPPSSISLSALWEALNKLLAAREATEPVMELPEDQVTVIDQMQYILQRAGESEKPLTFVELFSEMRRLEEIIITFLALLELVRCRQIRVTQHRSLDPILIELWSENS